MPLGPENAIELVIELKPSYSGILFGYYSWEKERKIEFIGKLKNLRVLHIQWLCMRKDNPFPIERLTYLLEGKGGSQFTFTHFSTFTITYPPLVYNRLHFDNHPPTPDCKRKLWTPLTVSALFESKGCIFQKGFLTSDWNIKMH